MTRFRPCIDLHDGHVKQIVGGTLRDGEAPETNFVSDRGPEWFANRYREDGLTGAHVIRLGAGNTQAARDALSAWPNGLQLGGGITGDNAGEWLASGAAQVILTSWLFDGDQQFQQDRLERLAAEFGPERIVVDLSCRRGPGGWIVAMNKWQTPTDLYVDGSTLDRLAPFCSEFLVHAADVEGLKAGMDEELIRMLGAESPLPITYAGGASSLDDLSRTEALSGGRVDLTIGSALDLFGGTVPYHQCVRWNQDSSS